MNVGRKSHSRRYRSAPVSGVFPEDLASRHSREGGNPETTFWVPASAGMTEGRSIASSPGDSFWLVASSFFASLRTQGLFRVIAAIVALLVVLTAWPQRSDARDEFLPPEQAYKYSTRVEDDKLVVTWKIEPGYYLYKKKLAVALAPSAAASGVKLGTPAWPKGESHTDEYFGEQEIYRGQVDIPVPLTFTGARPKTLPLELKLQGCADAGLCYPPLTWKTEVASASASAASSDGDLRSLLKSSRPSSSGSNDFLPPDDAFRLGVSALDAGSAALTWIIADGYYLYKDRVRVTSNTQEIQARRTYAAEGKAEAR